MGQYAESVWKKTYPEDPERCQATLRKGQCLNKSVPGAKHCPAHGGNSVLDEAKRVRVKQYLLSKYQARAVNLSEGDDLKSLRGEIGILRMILESRLNTCQSEIELAVNSPALSDLIMKIQKLVTSCHKLESALGKVMDESQLMNIADAIVKLLAEYIKDEKALQEIADRLGIEIARIASASQYLAD